MKRHLSTAVLAGLLACTVSAETRFHQYTAKYKNPPNPANPIAAGYIGGSGDEYLAGGAFLADGSVLLAGTCVGPKFDPAGIRVTVIGSDGSAPASPVKETKDRRGRLRLTTPNWEFTSGAGFIVHLAPGCKTVKKAVRFPWGSGALTDIVSDGKTGIYVTGTCGPAFSKLARGEKLDTGLTGSGSIFFGKIKSDLSGFEWCYLLADDLWTAPKLKRLKDGRLSLIATNAYHFSPAGKLLKATKLQTTNNWSRGVDPVTHATATGGDSNTNTGWEPWRQPVLFTYNSKGEHVDEFYRWSPKLVGLNCFRLVSDSDIRVLNYDNQGNLLVIGWSDGGNSVFERCCYDLKKSAYVGGSKGLGFSLWGAGVGSFCHIMKIDPRTGEPLGKTIFSAYLKSKNKPSGLGIDTVDSGVEDSMLVGGGSAYGLIETGNKVNTMDWRADDYIGGPFVAVFTPKMDSIRFSSCMPGGGNVNLQRHNKGKYAKWGIRSGTARGKPMALFVCGAKNVPKMKLLNCPQKGFGGGKLDGQYVILGL